MHIQTINFCTALPCKSFTEFFLNSILKVQLIYKKTHLFKTYHMTRCDVCTYLCSFHRSQDAEYINCRRKLTWALFSSQKVPTCPLSPTPSWEEKKKKNPFSKGVHSLKWLHNLCGISCVWYDLNKWDNAVYMLSTDSGI